MTVAEKQGPVNVIDDSLKDVCTGCVLLAMVLILVANGTILLIKQKYTPGVLCTVFAVIAACVLSYTKLRKLAVKETNTYLYCFVNAFLLMMLSMVLEMLATGTFPWSKADTNNDSDSNGYGKSYSTDGTLVYDGEWKGYYKRNGQGKAYRADGTLQYDGEWKNNKRNGNGKTYYSDGTLAYDGEWKDDMSNGNDDSNANTNDDANADTTGPHGEQYDGLNLLYFSATTFTTVGYGDVSPDTPLARACVVLAMMVFWLTTMNMSAPNFFFGINLVHELVMRLKRKSNTSGVGAL